MRWSDIEDHVDRRVTLVGGLLDAASGAVVVLEDCAVFVGFDTWPEDVHGKQVEASGTLRMRYPPPGASPRSIGEHCVLEDATWAVGGS